MDQLFNNREIAISIWAFIFLSWAFTKEEVRKSFKNVLLVFCHRAILTIFTLMAGYTYLIVDSLSDAGLWDTEQLKNTIMWFIFVAAIELFKSNKIHDEEGYFKSSILGHFKLLVALEFIIAFHSFSLITELFVVPLSALAVLLLAYAELKEEHKPVEKLMTWILSVFGAFMVGYGIYYISSNFGDFAQTKTLMNFITPIMLSVLLLPFIFVISVYMLYERILIRVNIYTENGFYRIYAKIKGLIHFKRNHKGLNNWLTLSCVSDFESRKTINASISYYEANKAEMV